MYRIRSYVGSQQSPFSFLWQKKTVHFFRQKNTVHRNILGQKSTGRSDGLISCVRYLNAAQFRKYVFLSTFFHPENNRKTYKNSMRAVLFANTIHIRVPHYPKKLPFFFYVQKFRVFFQREEK